jgi:hypothetical protein
MKKTFNCKQCGKEFIAYTRADKIEGRLFCSVECYGISRRGKIREKEVGQHISQSKIGHSVSQETRIKVGNFFRGKTYEKIMGKEKAEKRKKEMSEQFSGKGNPFYNKTHSASTIEKFVSLKEGKSHEEIMGEENAKKWHERMSGQNSPFWNGGYSVKDYIKFSNRFKNLIRKRDNQICMMCGKHREKMNTALSVHHVDYDKHNAIPQNCISLCFECHAKTNFNRKYWIDFFQNLLRDKYGYQYAKIEETCKLQQP